MIIPVLFAVSFLSFGMMRLAGSDVIEQKALNTGEILSQKEMQQEREEMGLDQPFLTQYFQWLTNFLKGDMGKSYVSGKDVSETLSAKLPATLQLAVVSLALTVLISIPFGILCAVYHGKWIDRLIRWLSFLGNCQPNFLVSLVLLYLFAIAVPVFPVISDDHSLHSTVLPAVTLAIAMSAKYVRQVRSVVLDELGKPYVMGEKARGIQDSNTLFKSVLKASFPSLLTLFSLSAGSLLGGTAVVESIFMWDGVGKMAVDAIRMRDYPLIQAYVLWMVFIYTLVNLITDLLYHYLNPQICLEEN